MLHSCNINTQHPVLEISLQISVGRQATGFNINVARTITKTLEVVTSSKMYANKIRLQNKKPREFILRMVI